MTMNDVYGVMHATDHGPLPADLLLSNLKIKKSTIAYPARLTDKQVRMLENAGFRVLADLKSVSVSEMTQRSGLPPHICNALSEAAKKAKVDYSTGQYPYRLFIPIDVPRDLIPVIHEIPEEDIDELVGTATNVQLEVFHCLSRAGDEHKAKRKAELESKIKELQSELKSI